MTRAIYDPATGLWEPDDSEDLPPFGAPWTEADDEYEAELKFNRDVTDELHRLRLRHEARERFRRELGETHADLATLVLDREQLRDLPTPEPLIPGVLDRHSYALLVGRKGSYKTFLALDWCLRLATGTPWQGIPTERVRVLYVAGEGAYGIDARVTAWEQAWHTNVDSAWFRVLPVGVDLFAGGNVDELLNLASGYGLVVLDTLRRMSGRADGNGPEMGVVIDNIERVKRATDDGTVLALAHTQKDDTDTRGFSGIEDDADIVWHAKRDDGRLVVSNRKMKNGPDGHKYTLAPTSSHGSLIIEGTAPDQLLRTDTSASQQAILDALGTTFLLTDGATPAELIEATGLAKSTFYHARGVLLAESLIESNGSVGRPRYRLPESTGVQPAPSNETPGQGTRSPTSPTLSNGPGPVQSSPPPLKGVDVGHGDLDQTPVCHCGAHLSPDRVAYGKATCLKCERGATA